MNMRNEFPNPVFKLKKKSLWFKANSKNFIWKIKNIFGSHLNKNIGNYRYIGALILRIYHRYIDEYFEKKYLKLIKIYKNIIKTS